MGGRGRGGGGAGTTVRAVANALGLARHEMGQYNTKSADPPPLYPPRSQAASSSSATFRAKPIPEPIETDAMLQYTVDVKIALLERFADSSYNLDDKETRDISRYTDKYSHVNKAKFEPDFSTMPDELCWIKNGKAKSSAKKRKVDDSTDDAIKKRLDKLEEREKNGDEKEEEEDEERSEKSVNVEGEALSDDDYAEEANDYVTSYFDNGEGYGDAGSDDNMDGEEY